MENVEDYEEYVSQSAVSEVSSMFAKETAYNQDAEFDEGHNIVVSATPLRDQLSAKYKHSCAYKTFRERVPAMITELIRCLRESEPRIVEKCGDYARYDLRRAIWSLEILRTEVLENSAFKIFHIKEPYVPEWNRFIKILVNREKNKWFSAIWLHAECYLYRRISAAFRRTETLRNFDYFSPKKICATRNLVYLIKAVLRETRDLARSRKNFVRMLKLSLWSNCQTENILSLIDVYDEHLLVDQSGDVWRLLTEGIHSSVSPVIVDIVLDNAGFELFSDLLLGEFLIDARLAKKVRYHVKDMPWFVSNATADDFHWMLRFFRRHEIPELADFGRKLRGLFRNKSLELCATCSFWTRPQGFSTMRELAPCLYVQLSLGALTIFKGDLNYRKLLDDTNWDATTPLSDCLGGFLPTSLCVLRSIKSDIYCGLPICAVEWLTEDDPNWMSTGKKAIIQLVVKTRP